MLGPSAAMRTRLMPRSVFSFFNVPRGAAPQLRLVNTVGMQVYRPSEPQLDAPAITAFLDAYFAGTLTVRRCQHSPTV